MRRAITAPAGYVPGRLDLARASLNMLDMGWFGDAGAVRRRSAD